MTRETATRHCRLFPIRQSGSGVGREKNALKAIISHVVLGLVVLSLGLLL